MHQIPLNTQKLPCKRDHSKAVVGNGPAQRVAVTSLYYRKLLEMGEVYELFNAG